jgi:hypothetical protein
MRITEVSVGGQLDVLLCVGDRKVGSWLAARKLSPRLHSNSKSGLRELGSKHVLQARLFDYRQTMWENPSKTGHHDLLRPSVLPGPEMAEQCSSLLNIIEPNPPSPLNSRTMHDCQNSKSHNTSTY